MRGEGQLAELAATYVMVYADGTEVRAPIRRRHQIGMIQCRWGENCFEAVAQTKPRPAAPAHEQPGAAWGWSQTRVNSADRAAWLNWLWAWENPFPAKPVVGLRFEPGEGVVIVSGVAAGDATAHPLRWQTRRKASLTLPAGVTLQPDLDEYGLLAQIQLDMGQVISTTPRLIYPHTAWAESYDNQPPAKSSQEVLIEYTAHPDACFHLWDGRTIPVARAGKPADPRPVADSRARCPTGHPADRRAGEREARGGPPPRPRRERASIWRLLHATACPTQPGSKTTAPTLCTWSRRASCSLASIPIHVKPSSIHAPMCLAR